jgi:hypothetical protein
VLFEAKPDLARLQTELRDHFAKDPFGIESAAHFTLTETAFRDNGHLKPVLRAAEAAGRVDVVEAKAKRRKGQYPEGTVLRFG